MYMVFLFRSPRPDISTSNQHLLITFVICHFSTPYDSGSVCAMPSLQILSQGGTHQPCLNMFLKQPWCHAWLHKRMYPTCFNHGTL